MDIYTMKDWERDGSLSPKVGQIVSADIIEDLAIIMPVFVKKEFIGQKKSHLECSGWD